MQKSAEKFSRINYLFYHKNFSPPNYDFKNNFIQSIMNLNRLIKTEHKKAD